MLVIEVDGGQVMAVWDDAQPNTNLLHTGSVRVIDHDAQAVGEEGAVPLSPRIQFPLDSRMFCQECKRGPCQAALLPNESCDCACGCYGHPEPRPWETCDGESAPRVGGGGA